MKRVLAVAILCLFLGSCGAATTPKANATATQTQTGASTQVAALREATATNGATSTAVVPATATALVPAATSTAMPTSIPPTATIPPTSVPPPSTPTATPPPLIPTLVPQPTMIPPPAQPSAAPFQSDGIGATRMDWERTHRQSRAGGPPFSYDSDRYLVTFAEGSPPVIYLILRQYSKGTTVPIETARAEIRGLLPSDARLITTTTADGDPLEIYHSDGLIGRFPANPVVSLPWYNDDPGTFTVSYQRDTSNKIQAVYVGAGGTP